MAYELVEEIGALRPEITGRARGGQPVQLIEDGTRQADKCGAACLELGAWRRRAKARAAAGFESHRQPARRPRAAAVVTCAAKLAQPIKHPLEILLLLLALLSILAPPLLIFDPVSPHGRRSHRMRWFSVPPVASLYPFDVSVLANAAAFALVCWMYALNSGVATSLSCVHSPAIWWLCGPPCSAGKTAKFTASSNA